MTEFPLPRKLTATEFQTVKDNNAENNAIFEVAGWFIPTPSGRNVSELGDKSVAYVDDARQIVTNNQAALNEAVPLDKFSDAVELHQQAKLLRDQISGYLVAPVNISLVAGAVAKKYADNLYDLLKSLVRTSARWKDDVKRLAARYEHTGGSDK